MLTPRQIRAARGLLGWEATELGRRTELSVKTIANIEAGRTQAQAGSMESIAKALMDGGVEFTDNQGVRLKPSSYETLVGPKGLQQFFNNVHAHAQQNGGTIIQFGVDEKQFLDHLGKEFSADYVRRMQQVSDERKDLKVLAIICEGETEYLAPDYNEYRWISKEFFQAVPFYIYGDTLAIMDFQTTPSPTITMLKSNSITSAYRKQFDAFWRFANKMSKQAKKGGGA